MKNNLETVTAPQAMKTRHLRFHEALREALDQALAEDPSVYVMGLGVPDPKGVFGTTLDLATKYGAERVLDMPTAENGMTGIAIGSAVTGMRPVMVHQRLDFAMLAIEQIVNQAANWHYMYGGAKPLPLVIRLIIGRGWGQGPQHSQALHAWFGHIPGLKVVAPAIPYDAKGMLAESIKDNNPVIFIEHRWCHNLIGNVPEEAYSVPLGKANVLRTGEDVTIVGVSFMTIEAQRAAEKLAEHGVSCEVIDLRSINPLDFDTIHRSIKKTKRLIVADIGWTNMGISAEILARALESAVDFKSVPKRIALPECPSPCTPALSKHFYPSWDNIANTASQMLSLNVEFSKNPDERLDIPDPSYTGPF